MNVAFLPQDDILAFELADLLFGRRQVPLTGNASLLCQVSACHQRKLEPLSKPSSRSTKRSQYRYEHLPFIVKQADVYGIPVFVKQIGSY